MVRFALLLRKVDKSEDINQLSYNSQRWWNIHLYLKEGKLLVSKALAACTERDLRAKSQSNWNCTLREFVPGTEFMYSRSTLPRQLPMVNGDWLKRARMIYNVMDVVKEYLWSYEARLRWGRRWSCKIKGCHKRSQDFKLWNYDTCKSTSLLGLDVTRGDDSCHK